jgi:tRNA threonylcarbamoyl adenosine modification protein (Sua5/YciO/YrdC/YwlC family)
MAEYLAIHSVTPQLRLVRQAVDAVRDGGLIVYPTDSCYALGCAIGNKAAQERIHRLRRTDDRHNFTLVCRDLSEIATYARVDNWVYRMLKAHTPGPYTFILRATGDVPRRLQNPRRRTVGIRVPDHPIALALLEELGEPLMSSTLLLPGDDRPLSDPDEIRGRLEHHVDLIVDGGTSGIEPTTVVDFSAGSEPVIVRQGRGDASVFAV